MRQARFARIAGSKTTFRPFNIREDPQYFVDNCWDNPK